MTIEVGDILRFTAKGVQVDNSEWNWVFHQRVSVGTTEADLVVLTALRDHLDLACNSLESELVPATASVEVQLAVWNTVTKQFDGTATLAWITFVGTSVDAADFNQKAMLIKFFTALARRQARKYIPGWPRTGNLGNVWDAPALAAGLAWSAILDDPLVTGNVTCVPGTWNQDSSSSLNETFADLVGATAVSTIPSTQRGRKVNVGI